ncbi:MAG: hypothetical protein NZO16_06710, partial [Deltaproteobacteria bacterium]|nr:hypothetical protein [Deltaproteobacteria bacterium]
MLYQPEWEVVLLDSWNKAKDAIDELTQCSTVAVDTETAGWQYGTNRLCLAQFSSGEVRKNYLFDCLVLEDLGNMFKPIIESKRIVKVAHNVSFEMRMFETLGLSLTNYDCTLELSKKLRPHLASFRLSHLAEYFLGQTLDKSWQTSDWSQRPLLDAQLIYAASDAEATFKIYLILKSIKERLTQLLEGGIDELLKNFYELTRRRESLVKPIFNDLCDIDYLLEEIREKVRQLLPQYDNQYENDYAVARLQEVRKTEVSIDLLRAKYPEIADLVIEPFVRRDKLKATF